MQKKLKEKILNYHLSPDSQGEKYDSEISRALELFARKLEINPASMIEFEPYCFEWLIFDFKLKNGLSLLENYLKNNFNEISIQEAEECKKILDTQKFGFFEVLNVWRGKEMQLKDKVSGKIYLIKDKAGAGKLEKGDDIFTRVGLIGKNWELISTQGFIPPMSIGKKILKEWKKNGELDFLGVTKMVIHQAMEAEDDFSDSEMINNKQQVGRNEPCICGSGKKYKKCCGS